MLPIKCRGKWHFSGNGVHQELRANLFEPSLYVNNQSCYLRDRSNGNEEKSNRGVRNPSQSKVHTLIVAGSCVIRNRSSRSGTSPALPVHSVQHPDASRTLRHRHDELVLAHRQTGRRHQGRYHQIRIMKLCHLVGFADCFARSVIGDAT